MVVIQRYYGAPSPDILRDNFQNEIEGLEDTP